jgi:uroporphyrinogen III methyltransferase / synthase
MTIGKVYIVGAGPGDPELFTLKGKRCLEECDMVVYDFLANPRLLNYCKKNTEIIYMGKKKGAHSYTQSEINDFLVKKAKEGHTITRLKGGDPLMFGRGGEEILCLVDNGIPFEIVPGISSALGAPAYAGIPPTHRDYASSLAVITGHEKPDKEESSIKWDKIATGPDTLIFLMGMSRLQEIVTNLVDNGRSSDTPCALIRYGTYPSQKTIVGTLSDIVYKAENAKLEAPVVIIVGEVVKLREKLRWFDTKPLFGKKIVVTRAREQISALSSRLEHLGADIIEYPTIKIVPPDSWEKVDEAINSIESYDWLVFTSSNGVKYFFERLLSLGMDLRSLNRVKIGSIGPATTEALKCYHLNADLCATEFKAEGILDSFKNENAIDKNILIPRAMIARDVLENELSKLGANVDVVHVYMTVKEEADREELLDALRCESIDIITFTASSTVQNFFDSLKDLDINGLMKGINFACIGPITQETLGKYGFKATVVPDEFTIPALCEKIVEFFKNKTSS